MATNSTVLRNLLYGRLTPRAVLVKTFSWLIRISLWPCRPFSTVRSRRCHFLEGGCRLTELELLKLLMQVSLLFSVQKLLLFSLPIYLALLYVIQRVFLRTSRQLRLMELESKSAVSSATLEAVCHFFRPPRSHPVRMPIRNLLSPIG